MLSAVMDAPRFIRANTKLLTVPLVPEIRLHLAEESVPIWQKTRGGARRDERSAALLGVRVGWWAGAGTLSARQSHGRRRPAVLDLGSGSGLVAIAAAKAGAARVLAADIDAFALAAIRLNAEVNAVSLETTGDDLLAAPPGAFDLVLVGDLFYERPLAERVLAFVDAACAGGAQVLAGDPRRSYFPPDRFRQLAEYSVPVTRELEDAEIKRTAVWRLDADRRRGGLACGYFVGAASSRRMLVAEIRSVSSSKTRRSTA